MYINIDETYKIKEILDESQSILIVTHKDPDGDAIGSSLGIYNAFLKMGYDVEYFLSKPSKYFSFLTNFDKAKLNENELKEKYDTLVVLDCGDDKRIALERPLSSFNNVISIDHHITHIEYANITFLDAESPATCQIIYDFLNKLNIDIDIDIAQCLYTGILTDTGGFKYSNVGPHTFEVAKILLETGIDIADITRKVFETMSYGKFNLLKLALNNYEIIDEKIAYLYLSKDQIDMYNEGEPDIHEGLVNYGRSIEGVEVSIFIREIGNGEYKISLRSNEYVDVAKISLDFSGGGHIRAAGASVEGNLNEIKKRIIDRVKQEVK